MDATSFVDTHDAATEPIRLWPWMLVILAGAFLLRFGVALVSPNIDRPDEIFQNLEPAYRLLTGHGVVTWEWHAGIRSEIFPGFLAGIMTLATHLGMGATGYLAAVAAAMSLLSTAVVWVAMLIGRRRFGWAGAILCGVLCAAWPDLVYFGAKPLAEVQAGNLLMLAAFLAESAGASRSAWAASRNGQIVGRMFAAGLLLGFAFCLRFHLSPAMLLIGILTCRTDLRRRWLPLLAGSVLPVLLMGLLDLHSSGVFLGSVWRNYQVNVTQHISNQYGVSPVYWYFTYLLSQWGGSAVVLGVAFLLGVRRAPMLAGVAAIIVLAHSAITHKEVSFIYAALPPVIIVAGLGTSLVVSRLAGPLRAVRWVPAVATASVLWFAICVATGTSAGYRGRWQSHQAVLRAEAALRRQPTLCGLGIRGPQALWSIAGGDVELGRPVPTYSFESPAGVARVAPAVNFVIGGPDVAEGLRGFSVMQCWSDKEEQICLARAEPGKTCTPDPAFNINNVPNLGRPGTEIGADHPAEPGGR